MDKFCIITNQDKDEEYTTTNRIMNYLLAKGKVCVQAESTLDVSENYHTDPDLLPDGTECAIVLGGDGTIIQAADDLLNRQIPILGVNLGTLGFLAEIEEQHIESALEHLVTEDYTIESRQMLEGEIHAHDEKRNFGRALNDIVITRAGYSRIITVEIYVNQELVTKYRGDGVIIATPTGSTGYNLSAGGPVIKPDARAIIITPICPHSLSARSIIVSSDDEIKVCIGRSKKTQSEEAIATFDGRTAIQLQPDDYLVVHQAEEDTRLVKIAKNSFFEVLRTKIGEGGE